MRLGPADAAVAQVFAETGSREVVHHRTGVLPQNVSRALQKPHVLAEIAKLQEERLFSVLLPAAIECLHGIIINTKAPAGARVQAAKVVFDRTLGKQEDGGSGKDPHEWTPGQLAAEIDRLTRLASEKAQVIEAQVIEAQVIEPKPDLFD